MKGETSAMVAEVLKTEIADSNQHIKFNFISRSSYLICNCSEM